MRTEKQFSDLVYIVNEMKIELLAHITIRKKIILLVFFLSAVEMRLRGICNYLINLEMLHNHRNLTSCYISCLSITVAAAQGARCLLVGNRPPGRVGILKKRLKSTGRGETSYCYVYNSLMTLFHKSCLSN